MSTTRILVLRFSSIGDIVLTTPVLRQLHSQLDGEVEVHYVTRKAYAPLVAHHPAVHTVHAFDKDLTEVLDAIMGVEFHYVVDLHHNLRSSIAKKKVKALDFTVDKRNLDKWLMVRFGIDRLKGQHIVERYLTAIGPFGLVDDGKGLDLVIPQDQEVLSSDFPDGFNGPFAALAMGAAHEGKRMTESQLIGICNNAPLPVVLLGGKEDMEMASSVAAASTGTTWNTAGAFSILQSASLVQQAGVLVAGDTGLMHIAAAVQTPVVSVWGCTSPKLGMAPWRPHPNSVIVEPTDRPKRPCSKLGNRCKYGKEMCIQTIAPSAILSALNAALS